MQPGICNKVVLVTGAASGLGRAVALLLASGGARLALTDIDSTGLSETGRQIRDISPSEFTLHCGDIVDPNTSKTLVDTAVRTFGQLDGVCNIAGMLGDSTIPDTSTEKFMRIMQVNCMAHLLTVQAALPALKERPAASIVNVASVGALVALPFMTAYCASKAAVLGLTRAMAAELGPQIRCNAICPGGIESRMSNELLSHFPVEERPNLLAKLVGRQIIKRFATPDEIAGIVEFLISDASIFITGATMPIDGGHCAW